MDTGDSVVLSSEDLARHTYLLGSTGCGKTTLILRLLDQDIKRGHTVVIVDLRGDLVTAAISTCARLDVDPARVTLLDLRGSECGVTFDPLGGAGEPYIRALHVLDVVAAESESWGVQLEESLRNALLLLAIAGQPLTRLAALLTNSAFRSDCLDRSQDEELNAFWERFDALSPERQQSWSLPVLNKVSPLLAVPTLRKVLSGNNLDLPELLNRPGAILLVSLAVDELHRSGRMLGSLLVSSIAREMMSRVNMPESDRNAVRLYVDEFENMASTSFESLIAEGRRFGLTLVLSHQTLSQLSPHLRSVVRNNVGVQVLFQCGYADAELISRELPGGIDADDVRRLPTGAAYVMLRSGATRLVQFHRPGKPASHKQLAAYRRLLSRHASTDAVLPAEPMPSATSRLEDLL